MSRATFNPRFTDEDVCARHLAKLRWQKGFSCAASSVCKAWPLSGAKAHH